MEAIAEIPREIRSLKPRQRRAALQRHANLLGISLSTLYRRLKAAGWSSGKKPPTTKGERKIPLTDEDLRAVAALQVRTHHLAGEKFLELPALDAIYLAEQNGIIPPGVLTAPTFNRWKRSQSIGTAKVSRYRENRKGNKIPQEFVHIRTGKPNELHELDASVCLHWFLQKRGGIGTQSRKLQANKNKPGTARPKLLRYILIDHFSGAFYVRYYATGGESTENALDFLFHAWSAKADAAAFPFRGVPEKLWTDRGFTGGRTSKEIRNPYFARLVENLGVDVDAHQPGNPRAKGLVEGWMRHWETHFETQMVLAMPKTVDELNERAASYAAHFQQTRKHKRHGQTRSDCFVENVGEVRECPTREVFKALCLASETRKVADDLTVSFRGVLYRVPRRDWAACRVQVQFAPFAEDDGAIRVSARGESVVVKPLATVAGGYREDAVAPGEFRAVPKDRTLVSLDAVRDADRGPVRTDVYEPAAKYPFAPSLVSVESEAPTRNIPRIEAKALIVREITDALDRKPKSSELDALNALLPAEMEVVAEEAARAFARDLIARARAEDTEAKREVKTG